MKNSESLISIKNSPRQLKRMAAGSNGRFFVLWIFNCNEVSAISFKNIIRAFVLCIFPGVSLTQQCPLKGPRVPQPSISKSRPSDFSGFSTATPRCTCIVNWWHVTCIRPTPGAVEDVSGRTENEEKSMCHVTVRSPSQKAPRSTHCLQVQSAKMNRKNRLISQETPEVSKRLPRCSNVQYNVCFTVALERKRGRDGGREGGRERERERERNRDSWLYLRLLNLKRLKALNKCKPIFRQQIYLFLHF